ncbi:hypothetical protein VTK26DRAFT_4487 [Humicola hyalothermophila]
MHLNPDNGLVDGSDIGSETSFPERHFTPCDEKPRASRANPAYSHSTAAKWQALEPSYLTLRPLPWPERNGPLQYNLLSAQSSLASCTLPHHAFQHTTPTNWDLTQPVGHHWDYKPLSHDAEDDSDLNPCSMDGLEECDGAPPTCPSLRQGFPQRNPRRATGLTRSHTARRVKLANTSPDVDCGFESEHNTDWLGLSAAPVVQPPSHDHAALDLAAGSQDGSSSSKADSKRIAHKLSEKSRRNRLTIAIREIQKLLPTDGKGGGGENGQPPSCSSQEDADFVVRTGVPSSKLDIVEMAVRFIKDLKEKNMEMAEKVREAERKLGECRCR